MSYQRGVLGSEQVLEIGAELAGPGDVHTRQGWIVFNGLLHRRINHLTYIQSLVP